MVFARIAILEIVLLADWSEEVRRTRRSRRRAGDGGRKRGEEVVVVAGIEFATEYSVSCRKGQRKGPSSYQQQSVMFVLTVLQDTLRIPPQNLSLPLQDALTQQICSLYFDKVLKDLGLCVTLYDIKAVEGGFVFPGDGAPRFTVDFRLVMFRPFIGEVLIAKLKSCDESGLYLSLGSFFDDIHIPEHLLQQPSTFDEEEKLWVWNYNGSPLYMDLDEDVRFRVVQVKYPPIPIEQDKNAKPFPPMQITGDVNADGLGLVAWWT